MATVIIFQTGGKQYKVQPGDVLTVEKLTGEAGDKLEFPVLLIDEKEEIQVGQPEVAGVVLEAEIVEQTRGKKVFGIKHKAKKRQLKKFGHKQHLTKIKIRGIKKTTKKK